MSNVVCYYKILMKEILTSPLLYAAIILFGAVCICGNSVSIDDTAYSVLETITDAELYRKACVFNNASVYLLWFRYDASPWFIVAVSVITTFPALQLSENHSGRVHFQILTRISRKKYIGSLYLAYYLSGVLVALGGIFLYGGLLSLIFPSFEANASEVMLDIYGISMWDRTFRMAEKVINCCLVCGLFPIITVSLYLVIHDRFFSVTLPMMLQYVSFKCNILYSSWLYADPEKSVSNFLEALLLLFPSNSMLCYTYLKDLVQLPFGIFFVWIGIITTVLYFVYSQIQHRVIEEKL